MIRISIVRAATKLSFVLVTFVWAACGAIMIAIEATHVVISVISRSGFPHLYHLVWLWSGIFPDSFFHFPSSSWILQSPQLQCAGSSAGRWIHPLKKIKEFVLVWWMVLVRVENHHPKNIHWNLRVLLCWDMMTTRFSHWLPELGRGYSPIAEPPFLPVSDLALPVVTSQSAWNSKKLPSRKWAIHTSNGISSANGCDYPPGNEKHISHLSREVWKKSSTGKCFGKGYVRSQGRFWRLHHQCKRVIFVDGSESRLTSWGW